MPELRAKPGYSALSFLHALMSTRECRSAACTLERWIRETGARRRVSKAENLDKEQPAIMLSYHAASGRPIRTDFSNFAEPTCD